MLSADGSAMRARYFASTSAVTGLLLACLATPGGAVANAVAPEPAVQQAAVAGSGALQREVTLLVELGAFAEPVPPRLVNIHNATIKALAKGARPPHEQLVEWLRAAEVDGQDALKALSDGPNPPSREIEIALGPLSPADWRALAVGTTIELPPPVYLSALGELATLSGVGPGTGPGAGLTGAAATTIAPDSSGNEDESLTAIEEADEADPLDSDTNNDADTDAGFDPLEEDSDADQALAEEDLAEEDLAGEDLDVGNGTGTPGAIPWPVAALAAVAVVALASVVWLRLRWKAGRQADLAPVLEAGRLLAAAESVAVVHERAAGEARSLVGAQGAAFYVRHGGGLHLAASDGALMLDPAAAPQLLRVAAVGQPWLGDVQVGPSPIRCLAVAIAEGGTIVGVLVVARNGPAKPFGAADTARLTHLAPLVGAALCAAGRQSELAELSLRDSLTKLANRRRLDQDLEAASQWANAAERAVGFVMIDVDHFKAYNDAHGHPAGDELLRLLAGVLAANVRPGDIVYRYGGEEFSILLPDADFAAAIDVGERVRRAVFDASLPGGESQPGGRVTVSVGIAVGNPSDSGALKNGADAALYEAKHAGRDRVVIGVPRR